MQSLTSEVRKQKPKISKRPVLMPNDPEILESKIRLKKGIPLESDTLQQLTELSKKFKVELKLLN